jgi:lysophospholipase L1-like esterase
MFTRSLRRVALATALLGLVALLPPSTAAAGTPAPPAPGAYAALGDSFSSGEGTFDYDPAAEAQACHRGPDAWPRFLRRRAPFITRILHTACTGARTSTVLSQLPATPDPDVLYVSLTLGGNDVGFSRIVRDCFVGSCYTRETRERIIPRLAALTQALTTTVYPAIEAAFPNARIAHVGYPQMTPDPGDPLVGCPWLTTREQQGGADLAFAVNRAIRIAAETDPRVEYADVTDALEGHELCSADPWVVPISVLGGSERGHPTDPGQRAIGRAVAVAVGFL